MISTASAMGALVDIEASVQRPSLIIRPRKIVPQQLKGNRHKLLMAEICFRCPKIPALLVLSQHCKNLDLAGILIIVPHRFPAWVENS